MPTKVVLTRRGEALDSMVEGVQGPGTRQHVVEVVRKQHRTALVHSVLQGNSAPGAWNPLGDQAASGTEGRITRGASSGPAAGLVVLVRRIGVL